MTDTATGTAAPLELKLGGKTYRMRPIGFAEIGEFERWVQQRHLDQIEQLIGYLDDAGKAQARLEAIRLAQRISMNATDADAKRIMDEVSSSVEGIARLVHLSVRREHPSVTLDEIAAAMENQANVEMAMSQFNRLNAGESGGDEPPKKKVTRKPKPRKKKSR